MFGKASCEYSESQVSLFEQTGLGLVVIWARMVGGKLRQIGMEVSHSKSAVKL